MNNSEIGDSRLYNTIEPIGNVLEKLVNIKGYIHTFDTSKVKDYRKHYSLIAQEIEIEFPELVKESLSIDRFDPILYKTIDHNQLIAVMLQAINDLNNKVNKLEKEIKGYKKNGK